MKWILFAFIIIVSLAFFLGTDVSDSELLNPTQATIASRQWLLEEQRQQQQLAFEAQRFQQQLAHQRQMDAVGEQFVRDAGFIASITLSVSFMMLCGGAAWRLAVYGLSAIWRYTSPRKPTPRQLPARKPMSRDVIPFPEYSQYEQKES